MIEKLDSIQNRVQKCWKRSNDQTGNGNTGNTFMDARSVSEWYPKRHPHTKKNRNLGSVERRSVVVQSKVVRAR